MTAKRWVFVFRRTQIVRLTSDSENVAEWLAHNDDDIGWSVPEVELIDWKDDDAEHHTEA